MAGECVIKGFFFATDRGETAAMEHSSVVVHCAVLAHGWDVMGFVPG